MSSEGATEECVLGRVAAGKTPPAKVGVEGLVSIVVINYNYAGYLTQAVNSALQQTYPACEVVVVDDASTDGSLAVIGTLGAAIRIVSHPTNKGQAAAFNSGFLDSSGEFVMFLDADDFLYPEAAARHAEALGAGAVQSQARLDLVNEKGEVIDAYPPREMAFEDAHAKERLLQRGRYSTSVTSGLGFRRTYLEQVLPMDEHDFSPGADGYLASLAPLFGAVASVEDAVGCYRIHGSNHSQFGAKLAERARWRVHHDILRYQAVARFAPPGAIHPQTIGLRDTLHVDERLMSLLAEPAAHPFPGDTARRLAFDGVAAARGAPLSRGRKLALQLSYILMAALPRTLSLHFLSWRLVASSRPAWLKAPVGVIRRALS